MSESFDDLRGRRKRYVDSARDNDFEEGLRTLLAELYPDNAHFIYELLQNAEDARASQVEFVLEPDRLVVTHDGARPFDLADVEAITSIGKSTKRDDTTQIGKFGVGFKAVFAYTNNPEVHSGRQSFVIRDLFVPEKLVTEAPEGRTMFVFPFDRPEKPAGEAYEEIRRGLQELAGTSVLFLTNVRSIRYAIAAASGGSVERIDAEAPEVRIVEERDGESVESLWIRLVGRAGVEGARDRTVAAAFLLGRDETKGKEAKGSSRLRVTSIEHADTCIYFPAAKEKSGLRFHIHAPFASTVARDSVRDTRENSDLIAEIGRVIVDALPALRDRGLVDDGLLAALPNPDDDLVAPYSMIQELVRAAFENDSLTPVIGGGYAPSLSLVRSPSAFRGAMSEGDLEVLTSLLDQDYPSSPRWIPDRDGRAGRFLGSLRAYPFGWSELDDVFEVSSPGSDSAAAVEMWASWLQTKTLQQHRQFLTLLGQGFEDDAFPPYYSNIRHFGGPIVRIRDGGHVSLAAARGVYLAASTEDQTDGRVVSELAYFESDEPSKEKSRLAAFYQGMGIKRWDRRAAVSERLRAYRRGESPGERQHLADLREFIAYRGANPRDSSVFEGEPFLRCESRSSAPYDYVAPGSVFLDVPFRETGLATLYSEVTDDDVPSPLWGGYSGKVAGLEQFVISLGARDGLRITEAWIFKNPELEGTRWYEGRSSHLGTERDWEIEHLPEVLASGDPRLLSLLWLLCCESPESYRLAVYQRNGQSQRFVKRSQLAIALSSTPWVLDRSGNLRSPESMTSEELPDGWPEPPPKSLALALGFGADALARDAEVQERARRADEAGVPLALVDAWALLPPDQQAALLEEIEARQRANASFPSSTSANPFRRATIVGEDAGTAPKFQTERRERSVVVGKGDVSEAGKQYLRSEYTTDDGTMFCQACQMPLPFKVNGNWYFEATQFVGKRARQHHQNALALCPLCAALYKYARSTSDESMAEVLLAQAIGPDIGQVIVPAVLDGKRVEVWFTGKHALDLQAVLRAAGGERA